jgi:hypothetical protein
MFNSSYGGIESDGMLHGMRPEPPRMEENEKKDAEAFSHNTRPKEKKGIFGSSFLKNLQTDDLILIGIALLLLLDGEEDNDIFVFIIAALIFLS